jgi:hypothetical protein
LVTEKYQLSAEFVSNLKVIDSTPADTFRKPCCVVLNERPGVQLKVRFCLCLFIGKLSLAGWISAYVQCCEASAGSKKRGSQGKSH